MIFDLCYKVDMKVQDVRRKIANFINSEVNEVVFTSGDTEALNLIAYGYALSNLKKVQKNVNTKIKDIKSQITALKNHSETGKFATSYLTNTVKR